METLVSAIIPTHDRPEKLKRAIRSVEAQTHSPIELIVVGSPETPDIEYEVLDAEVKRAKYCDASATSPAAARNVGIKEAEGGYLAFLDDDDEWKPSKTERQLARISETDTAVCYVGVEKIGENGKTNGVSRPTTEGNVTQDILEKRLYGTLSAMMVQRDLAQMVGGFDEGFITREDGDFCIRLSLFTEFSTVSDPLVTKYAGDHTQITDDVDTIFNDNDRIIKKYSGLASQFGENTKRAMISTIRHGEGQSAANHGRYIEAQRSFIKAIRRDPRQLKSWIWLLLVAAGPLSFRPVRYIKRKVVRIVNNGKST